MEETKIKKEQPPPPNRSFNRASSTGGLNRLQQPPRRDPIDPQTKSPTTPSRPLKPSKTPGEKRMSKPRPDVATNSPTPSPPIKHLAFSAAGGISPRFSTQNESPLELNYKRSVDSLISPRVVLPAGQPSFVVPPILPPPPPLLLPGQSLASSGHHLGFEELISPREQVEAGEKKNSIKGENHRRDYSNRKRLC
eukprot:TRINITY_DN7042_c0_g1_i1.p1 TRINITY_DN7042_c0_g1~~TRINITY_DN7042_c0_g1_i1.p1  ORF type:complete len:194 (+),score=42.44 TRINITY_DN7042_c0_g1_i1:169-750(+)